MKTYSGRAPRLEQANQTSPAQPQGLTGPTLARLSVLVRGTDAFF